MEQDRLQAIDNVFEEAVAKLKELIDGLDYHDGNVVECMVLHAWGDLDNAADKINQAKELNK